MFFRSGYLTFGNYDYSTTMYFKALYNYLEANYSRFGKATETQFVEVNTGTSGEASVDFCTNTASFSTKTASIVGSGGTTAGTGNIALLCDTTTFFNTTSTAPSMNIAPSGSSVSLNFKTNSANYAQTTAFITITSGSGTGTGNISHRCGGTFIFNSAETQSLRINPNALVGAVDLIYRCNTGTPSQSSVTIRADNGTGTNNGTLSTYCGKTAVRASTGNFCAMEQSVGTNTATLNFKSSTANDVVSSSIIATGGSATANTGTITITADTLNLNVATTTFSNTTTTISSPTTNLTGASVNLTGDLYLTNGSGDFKMWDNVSTNSFRYIFGSQTLNCDEIPWNCMFSTQYANGSAFTITLAQSRNFENTFFTIYNGGSANITLQTGSGARFFGPSMTRGGQTSLTIGSNSARRIRGSVFNSTAFLNNVNDNGWFIENIQ
jgi:hypothetical protein